MFLITVQGQTNKRDYDCEQTAFIVFHHLTLLYPSLNIQLYEEVCYEAYNLLKEHNPIVRYENPFKTCVWLGVTRLESSGEFNNRKNYKKEKE